MNFCRTSKPLAFLGLRSQIRDMRLLLLIGVIFLVVASLIGMTHFWGLSQPIVEYPTPFFERVSSIVPWDGPLPPNAKTCDEQRLAWQVPVQTNSRHELRLVATTETSRRTWPDNSGPSLEEWLSQQPPCPLFVQVLSNVENIHQQVAKAFGAKWDSLVLMQSDVDTVVQALRPLKPTWAYGTSSPDRMRLLTFESLAILPATPLKVDAWVGPLMNRSVALLNHNVMKELRRRKKKIVIGPIQSAEELMRAQLFGADAVIYSASQMPTQAPGKN